MDIWYYILRWVNAWCDVIDGLFSIVTLGFWNPGLGWLVIVYNTKRLCKRLETTRDIAADSSERA